MSARLWIPRDVVPLVFIGSERFDRSIDPAPAGVEGGIDRSPITLSPPARMRAYERLIYYRATH